MADGVQLEVLIIRYTEHSLVADIRRGVLLRGGFVCGEPVTLDSMPERQFDRVLLLGVGANLERAREVRIIIESRYPGVPLTIITHHVDLDRISFFKGSATVLMMDVADAELIDAVAHGAKQTAGPI